jgi:hypothetical protein
MNRKRVVLAGALLASTLLIVSMLLSACASRAYVAYRVPAPPPPPVEHAVAYAPAPGYAWVDGFWDLHGTRWVWVSGRWTRPPRPGAVWVRSYWEPYGRNWRFHAGSWR